MRQLKISTSITNRHEGSLVKYLTDIAREDLLTADEEVALAQRIKQGDEAALDRLVRCNLRFVVSVAKQYQNQGLSLPDLISQGNLGLIKAARRFDETRGFKFISYAVWWIRQGILLALAEQPKVVRVPLNIGGGIAKLKKASAILEQELQRKPSAKEIAEYLDLDVQKVDSLLNLNVYPISTDAPISEDDDNSFIDTYVPADAPSTDNHVERESISNMIQKFMNRLSDKEKDVLNLYYGIGVNHEYTIEEISSVLGISRERVRQIKERAIKRFRQFSPQNLYQVYYG